MYVSPQHNTWNKVVERVRVNHIQPGSGLDLFLVI